MNPSSNPSSNQQGDPNWVTHESTWEHSGNANHYHHQHQHHHQHQQQQPVVAAAGVGTRSDWEWDNQMMLLPSSSEVEAQERKPQLLALPTATICNRPYASNYPTATIPHNYQHHNAFNVPAAMRSTTYAGLDGSGGAYHGHHPAAAALVGQAADLNAELRSYDQRRRFLGMHLLDPEHSRNVLDFVKREDMYSLGEHARIGLNLGGRTYFSAEDSRLGKRSRLNSLAHVPMCQVQGCTADLGKAKHYHRRHKVCEIHSKAPNVIANGQTQRFCQQCSRFHQLSEFDDTKRSCRKRLADHNRRRRKPQPSAVVTIAESSYKTEEQSTNIRPLAEGDHKPMLIHMQKSGSPSASITDRDSISSGGNNMRLQSHNHQSPPTYDEKMMVTTSNNNNNSNRDSLLRSQGIPSSHVQALVLSVVSRTGSSTQSTRQSVGSGTQESGYQYLQGPSLSLSSAGLSGHHSSSSQNYSSMEQQASVPWLAAGSGSRSTLVQARPLQSFPPNRDPQSSSSPQFMLQPSSKASEWMMGNMPREQLGRLGLQNVHSSIDGRQMLALIENPGSQQQLQLQQQQQPQGNDGKSLQASEMQHSGVRSSFGSSFYDSSSSIG